MTHAPYKVFVDLAFILNMPCQRQIQSTICIDVQQGCVACTGSGPPDLAIL